MRCLSPFLIRRVNPRFSSGSGRHEKVCDCRCVTTCSQRTETPLKVSTRESLLERPKVVDEEFKARVRLSLLPVMEAEELR